MKKNIQHSMPTIDKNDIKIVTQTLKNNYVGKGNCTEMANIFLQNFVKKKKSYIVNSGSAAIFLSLKALKIKKGDEVIVSVFGCPSLINQIINLGAKPIVIDTIENSFFIDTKHLINNITVKTKAILFHHPFGYFDSGINEIKTKIKIPIIEDITQSIGAKNGNLVAGTIGDIVVSSFGSTKFVTSGTGGFLATSENSYIERINKIIDYDYVTTVFDKEIVKHNLLLGDLNSSLLISQLEKLKKIISQRQIIADTYTKKIKSTFFLKKVEGAVYFRFFLKIDKKNATHIIEKFSQEGINCVIGGIKLISEVINLDVSRKWNAENLHKSILSIPIYPSLSEKEINHIIVISNKILSN